MTATPRPNRDALTKAVDIYRDAMRPFLLRCLKQVRGATLERAVTDFLQPRRADEVRQQLNRGDKVEDLIDVNDFPTLVQRHWREVFSSAFRDSQTVQSELWLIASARNQVAHPGAQDLEREYASTHIWLIANVLGKINAPEQKKAVEDILAGLMAPEPGVVMPLPVPPDQPKPEPRPVPAGLKRWSVVIRPNQDVAQGSYQQAEFAADLQQVYDGRANATQYGNPVDFYDHTYITPGIRTLLVNALKRLAGNGGDPVIQTKTGFGGGKTHSLIALYHLVRNTGSLLSPRDDSGVHREIRSIMAEAGYGENTDSAESLGEVAVLSGVYLATTDTAQTREKGDPLNTLWGVMAYQLAGQEGYDLIGAAARQGTAPGGQQLDALLEHIGPCVILIDELVAYVRNAGPAQDSIYTFIQALTESVRRSGNVSLVITLTESAVEAGSEVGAAVLARLESLMGRIEKIWEPLAINEAFEVIRRRLFTAIADPEARDQTCEAFVRIYSQNRGEYPQGVSEQNYLERMKACYPIHPEIFDRLYYDWSSIPDFQRTRGVLRLMADCISRLYRSNDSSPLILPGSLPFYDDRLANEFNRLLSGEWGPALAEVDRDNSRTDDIDRASQRFSEVGGAARRIARAVFLGSAPSGAVRGLDARQIHLGVVQPGQGYARYNEALARMTGNLYYLYHSEGRYYFHSEANLNKVVSDRADNLDQSLVDACIVKKLEEARHRRADVVLYDGSTEKVPDTDAVRLVVLPPNLALSPRASDAATPAALQLLTQRGDADRFRRNTLLFLAARQDEIRSLREAARSYLAWDSIINGDNVIAGLTDSRLSQAKTEVIAADGRVRTALVGAYRWLLYPRQDDPQQAEFRFCQARTEALDGEIFNAAFRKAVEDEALVDAISVSSLSRILEAYFWNRGKDISVNDLWDEFSRLVYLPRLRSRGVLEQCIIEGVAEGAFGHASRYNDAGEDGPRYEDLRYGGEGVKADGVIGERQLNGLLVHPKAAEGQKERERNEPGGNGETPGGGGGGDVPIPIPGPDDDDDLVPPPVPRPRRIVVRRTAVSDISLDEISQLRNEIIRNLSADGVAINVEIAISASKPDGFSEEVIRPVRDNSVQLKLGFELHDE